MPNNQGCVASIQFCSLRIGRLNAVGQVPAGTTNSYVTNLLGKLTVKWELEAGVDIVIRDGCGGMPFTYKTRDIPKRYDLQLDIKTPDPQVHELLLAQPLIVSPASYGSRTVTDGATTSGVATITSATAAFTNADVGATVTATGIPALTTIVSITSATVAALSANATATGTTLSTTIARPLPAGMSTGDTIGSYAQPLSTQPTDNGVSMEAWSKVITGSSQAVQLPWWRWGFFQTFWAPMDRVLENAEQVISFTGFGVSNPGFGTGPGRDWLGGVTGTSPTAPYGYYRDFAVPTPACGYTAVVGAPT